MENRAAYLFLVPWLLGLVCITAGPLLASLYLAFTRYDVLTAPVWIGADNFITMLTADARFWRAAKVTLTYVAVSVPAVLVVSLLLAVVLNRGLSGLAIYRTLFYIPSLIGSSVAIALLWRQVFGADGIFNDLMAFLGLPTRSWIGHPRTALDTLILLHVWTFGATMVIFLAALRQIPQELYEAARIDGAGTLQQFRHVTLPLLTPVTFFNIVLLTIHSFQAFTHAHVVSNGSGGPIDSTLFYTLYLYQRGFVQLEMGYAAAMAWLLLLTIGACTAFYFWTARYWVHYGDQ
jgi:multiple sugar transport system permease protein